MKQVLVKGELRHEVGKGAARKARARGQVPAVIYGKGKGTTLINLSAREFSRAVQAGLGVGKLINLVVSGDGDKETTKTVILKELQRDSIAGDVIHADLQEISMTEAINAEVPVVLVGEDKRVNDGGVLEHLLWKVELHGLPAAIPERIEVQVSGLRIGDSLKVGDLRLPEGVRALTHADETVVTVAAPAKAAEEEKPAAAAEAPETPQAAAEKKEE